MPFATGWMGENHFARPAMVMYGVILLMVGVAYWILQSRIIALEGPNSTLARAIGRDFKGLSSPPLYVAGIAASFWNPWVAGGIYVAVALMWLIPDRRIERTLVEKAEGKHVG